MVQLSHSYMTTGKAIALTIQTFVSKVMSLLFNMLSRFVRAFLPKNKHLLISWLKLYQIRSDQSLSHVRLFATLWIAAHQASLSITNSRSSLRLTAMESVMPSSHLILCQPPSPLALNLSQHQGLFQWVGSSHQVAKVLDLQLQHQSSQRIFRVDFL